MFFIYSGGAFLREYPYNYIIRTPLWFYCHYIFFDLQKQINSRNKVLPISMIIDISQENIDQNLVNLMISHSPLHLTWGLRFLWKLWLVNKQLSHDLSRCFLMQLAKGCINRFYIRLNILLIKTYQKFHKNTEFSIKILYIQKDLIKILLFGQVKQNLIWNAFFIFPGSVFFFWEINIDNISKPWWDYK